VNGLEDNKGDGIGNTIIGGDNVADVVTVWVTVWAKVTSDDITVFPVLTF